MLKKFSQKFLSSFLIVKRNFKQKRYLFLIGILFLAAFLRFYRLSELMMFVGDQGYYYLLARNIFTEGTIPLVGTASSHTWLHHGPIWSYFVAILFAVFHFDPIAPAVFIALLGIINVGILYLVTKEFISEKVGVIIAFLYAASPLVILNSRMPFHTSPIPLVALLFIYTTYKWVKGSKRYFPISIFLMALLYNFELATVALYVPFLLLFIYGFFTKKSWVKNLADKKIIGFSTLGLIVPLIPILIYDSQHNFRQTLLFPVWILYRVFKFGSHVSGVEQSNFDSVSFIPTFFEHIKNLLFAQNIYVAGILFVLAVCYVLFILYKGFRNKKVSVSLSILSLYFFIPLVGLLFHRAPSDADILILFPQIFLILALLVERLLQEKFTRYITYIVVFVLVSCNTYFLLSTNFYINTAITFTERIQAVDRVIGLSNNRPYNLVGKGILSEFETYTDNYQYLLWWKGHPVSKVKTSLTIIVSETTDGRVNVYEEHKKTK